MNSFEPTCRLERESGFYRTTATNFPAAVIMLDLAREQLIESTAAPITKIDRGR